MLEDLDAAAPGSIVLLHACAHNPTGVDPTLDEWRRVLDVVQRRRLQPFFDMAYQVRPRKRSTGQSQRLAVRLLPKRILAD